MERHSVAPSVCCHLAATPAYRIPPLRCVRLSVYQAYIRGFPLRVASLADRELDIVAFRCFALSFALVAFLRK